MGGEQEITAENGEKILSSVGVEADKEKLKLVIASCKGKSLEELIAAGSGKLASLGGGGGGAAPAAAAAPGAAAPAAAEAKKRRRRKSPRKRMTTWASASSTEFREIGKTTLLLSFASAN